MSSIKGKKVLITGGANGIGKIMGELSLEKGASDLVIWDINETNLQQTADALIKQGYRVHPYQVDVSDLNDIKWAFETVFNEIGPIDILINNAGIVVGKDFNDHSFEDIKRTIDINVLAVMNVTKLCLDQMINQNMGHIVNIASAAGLMGNPKMSVYASSKWAVLGWSESLRIELEKNKTKIMVTTVCPGYIDTGMFDGVKMNPFIPVLKPSFIANKIIEAILKDKPLIQEPFMVKTVPALKGILPTKTFDFLAGKIFDVYSSMDEFKGRAKETESTVKR